MAELAGANASSRRDPAREEYDLGYSASNIDDVTLADGAWWPEPVTGPAKMALEDREAEQLGLGVGDVVTFTIEGRELEVETAAIFSQRGLQTRFWFEAFVSDGALEGFVNRHVGTAYMSDAEAIVAQRRIGEIAPNVITVRTASLLASAREILGKAAASLAVVAGVSLAASLLVLVSVMAAGRARQVYDATVLHSLGTRLGVIRRSLQMEYLLLAAITSSFAVLLGSGVALLLLRVRLKLPAEDLLWLAVVTALLVSGVSLSLAARYLSRRLRPRPAVLLREG
jgi:putative ABC transport system permease protein